MPKNGRKTTFDKPGLKPKKDYTEYAVEAATKALTDANINFDDIEFATAGYVYGDSCYGQRALYQLGTTQIPIINTTNACATGSTALLLARQAVAGGLYDCALAVGFEKMNPGPLKGNFPERTPTMDQQMVIMNELAPFTSAPRNPQIFTNAALEYCEKNGQDDAAMDYIASKNHNHSQLNPYSQFRHHSSLEDVRKARPIYKNATLLHCSPPSCGSAAAVVCSEDFVKAHGLEAQAVEIVAQAMATDSGKPFAVGGNAKSLEEIAGADMTRKAIKQVYAEAGIKASDVDVIELHDCFSGNELITIDALELCEPGKASDWVKSGAGHHPKVREPGMNPKRTQVINGSGGLISKGHPLGATGLAQCCELSWQLRGWAGPRQVEGAKLALQHNVGLGGVVVCTLYKKAFGPAPAPPTWKERFGYNPAVEARGVTIADIEKVASKKAPHIRIKEELFGQDQIMQAKI
ncbi:thiolase-like protein [Hyaloraphidium curvatum]|nr:thiolase-like protein [Hyaloraphidium curvatum]